MGPLVSFNLKPLDGISYNLKGCHAPTLTDPEILGYDN